MWPDFFPDECPPDPLSSELTIYRFVRRDPPPARDFESHRERDREADFGDLECQACGLSVHVELEAARTAQRTVPGMAKKYIAECALAAGDGGVRATPSHRDPEHYTWWVPLASSAPTRFRVVQPPIVARPRP